MTGELPQITSYDLKEHRWLEQLILLTTEPARVRWIDSQPRGMMAYGLEPHTLETEYQGHVICFVIERPGKLDGVHTRHFVLSIDGPVGSDSVSGFLCYEDEQCFFLTPADSRDSVKRRVDELYRMLLSQFRLLIV